jgi:multiple sugar transport system permease protein
MRRSLAYLVLLPAAALAVYPLLWVIAGSFKADADVNGLSLVPTTTDNYSRLFRDHAIGSWLINSAFLASTISVIGGLLASLGGFALAKYRFRGRSTVTALLLLAVLVPLPVMLPGLYEIVRRFGWLDSFAAIIVPGLGSVLGLLLFRQACVSLPDELLDAARIDGCGEFRLWWDIALPLVRPTLSTFILLTCLGAWNAFLWPAIVLQRERNFPLAVGLSNLVGLPGDVVPHGLILAGVVVGLLPIAGLFLLVQRDLIAGLSAGAVKG